MTEQWATIPGFDNYEVSDLGRFRSLPRQRTKGGIIKPWKHGKTGYLSACLMKDGKARNVLAHRLVLLAHVGPAPEGTEAAHRNGIRDDNRLTNLYWATVAENAADKQRHGTHRRVMGEKRVLSMEDAAFIRAKHKVITQRDLAAMFGVHRGTIQRIHSGERYQELP